MQVLVNDIIDVEMNLDLNMPQEDLSKAVIDVSDYEQIYKVSYCNTRTDETQVFDFTVEAGLSLANSDIKSYLEQGVDVSQIEKFEILEVNSNDSDNQTAKIKVISIKK